MLRIVDNILFRIGALALMMQTVTFAKRRHIAEQRRGDHPEAINFSNNSDRESLKHKIRSLHGEAILGSVNLFTKYRKSLNIKLSTLAFLKRCRDHDTIPKCFQLKSPFQSKQAKSVLRQASMRLVRQQIGALKYEISQTSQNLFSTTPPTRQYS